jgi:leucyl aminopeptidase (aminopeptidase T)
MLRDNTGLKDGEKVVVLVDIPSAAEVAHLDAGRTRDFFDRVVLARAVADLSRAAFPKANVDFLPYPSVGQHGTEVPNEIAERMREVQVVLAMTTYSLTHTEATAKAARAGARIASMPGITAAMFKPGGPMAVDHAAVRAETRHLAELMTKANQVRVTSPAGTDLSFSLEGRQGGSDDGFLGLPGAWGNLPAGEAFAAPVEGTAAGRLVVGRGWYPGLTEDLVLEFSGGQVERLSGGGEVGASLAKVLELTAGGEVGIPSPAVRARRNCAELGIGTNPNARTPDNVLEAEKIRGTIHIAIGDSSHLGGVTPADLHEDFIIPGPDVYFDGRMVIQRGRLLE